MIPIDEYRGYWAKMVARVNAKVAILVRDESEFSQYVKNLPPGETYLIAVIPSTDSDARNTDAILEKETVVVYAVRKVDRTNQTELDIMDTMKVTQLAIKNIKTMLLWDATNCSAEYHEMMKRIAFGSFHTDPEYNYFGMDGYSLSFEITTPGF